MKKLENKLALVSLIVAVASAGFSYTIANKALEASKNSFLAEKRPYLDVYIPKFENSNYYLGLANSAEGTMLAHRLEIKNEGSIAARDIDINIHRIENSQETSAQGLYIKIPSLSKILPGKSTGLDTSFGSILSKDKNIASIIDKVSLTFQVVVRYKSDFKESAYYETRKQFRITKDAVILVGSLGEFQ